MQEPTVVLPAEEELLTFANPTTERSHVLGAPLTTSIMGEAMVDRSAPDLQVRIAPSLATLNFQAECTLVTTQKLVASAQGAFRLQESKPVCENGCNTSLKGPVSRVLAPRTACPPLQPSILVSTWQWKDNPAAMLQVDHHSTYPIIGAPRRPYQPPMMGGNRGVSSGAAPAAPLSFSDPALQVRLTPLCCSVQTLP